MHNFFEYLLNIQSNLYKEVNMPKMIKYIFFVALSMIINVSLTLAVSENTNQALIFYDGNDNNILNSIEIDVNLAKGKVNHRFPPNIIMADFPSILDKKIETKYNVKVYRKEIDMPIIEKYGEMAICAISIWNKNFEKDDIAQAENLSIDNSQPMPQRTANNETNSSNNAKGVKHQKLKWKEIPGATHYRLQISSNSSFETCVINTITDEPRYKLVHTEFLEAGQYYWRVCGLKNKSSLLKEQKGIISGKYSAPVQIYISPSKKKIKKANNEDTSKLITQKIYGREPLEWEKIEWAKYYWVQVSSSASFDALLIDEVVEKPFIKTTDSILEYNNKYNIRIKLCDENNESNWINLGTFDIGFPKPIINDAINQER